MVQRRKGSGSVVEGPTAAQATRAKDEPPDIGHVRDLVEDDDFDWEEGDIGVNGDHEKDPGKEWDGEVTLEVEGSAGKSPTVQRKTSLRRATAKDKEFAEMVHKAHLLCLLARGRILDAACNDILLQASILSVLPPSLGLSADVHIANTKALGGIVSWFMRTFRVLSAGEGPSSSKPELGHEELSKRLLQAVQKQAGSAEEVTALAVSLLRSLGFTTRYVMILDVASLKPDADSLELSEEYASGTNEQGTVFLLQDDMETSKVASLARILSRSVPQQVNKSQKWNSSPDSERSSPMTGGENKEGGDRSGRSRGGHSLRELGKRIANGEGVVQDSKRAKIERGKGKGIGRGRGKTGSASGSPEVPRVIEPEAEAPVQRRTGDDEFERELAMAIAATAAAAESKDMHKKEIAGGVNASPEVQPFSPFGKKLKSIKGLGNASLRKKVGFTSQQDGVQSSGAVWSRKLGAVMHWAEVYCIQEGMTGRWVHVDAARGIVDGADKIEGAAAACRLPLRYVVAFAGGGAKDVTRRYVTLWSTVSPLRVDSGWWDETISPLKQLEAVATAGPAPRIIPGESHSLKASDKSQTAAKDVNGSPSKPDRLNIHDTVCITQPEHSIPKSTAMESRLDHEVHAAEVDPRRQHLSELSAPYVGDRSALEDMEMETKTFTEPLPTNQQAYKSHHLYALERWLTKYQVIYPKGPVLGYCAGHAVYPRTCVQVLHTPDRWLQEGFKVKSGESPAKVIKASRFSGKGVDSPVPELDGKEENVPDAPMTSLYGKWQTQAWQPPRAVNGIVPRNERGQVDAWSEKCIPPGTVHLRFPRLVPIAQRLEIDFAPAMVGFEVHKGRALPVYEGIVVCEEFKDVILDAYSYQEEVRFGELQKKREDSAAKRWWQLLHSMATRQRLQATYEATPAVANELNLRETPTSGNDLAMGELSRNAADLAQPSDCQPSTAKKMGAQKQKQSLELEHVHHFPEENQSYDEDTGIRTKQCSCGFTYYVEEM